MNGKCFNAIRKMYILFYVDDAVIPAGTPVDLQNSLNEFYSFFEQWNYFFHVQCLSKKLLSICKINFCILVHFVFILKFILKSAITSYHNESQPTRKLHFFFILTIYIKFKTSERNVASMIQLKYKRNEIQQLYLNNVFNKL